jgi:carbon-monoxide dehydrogenase large subunit
VSTPMDLAAGLEPLHSIGRVEDGPLLRGAGRFVDDIELPRMLHIAFVRSPIAHAVIRGIEVLAAQNLPGVRAVLKYADLRPLLTRDRIALAMPSSAIRFHVDPPVLASDETCYVGEPIALVVAESRSVAEDAAALVQLELDPLPAVADIRTALEPSAPRTRLDCPSNLVAEAVIQYGDVDDAFVRASHVVSDCFCLHKGGGHSIEARGLVAQYDRVEDLLAVWDSTQMPHRNKSVLVEMLGLSESQVRVVTPDVGGGFGPKAVFHPEELAVPAAALLLRAPLKWTEDRRENFVCTVLERDQYWEVEMALDSEGRLLAVRGQLIHDHGACTPYGSSIPQNAATNLIGPYALPAYKMKISSCLTNMVPTAPTRGAGRPQGTFVMERMLDLAAERLRLGRDEIRRRNLIRPEQMPYTTPIVMRDGSSMTYDSGDYPECQRRVLEAAGWQNFPARQEEARLRGRWIGIGLSNYVELTGRGPFESVSVRIGPSGRVLVTAGATAQGQGTKSMLVAIVARELGIDPGIIDVKVGDTASSILGIGAFASRQTVTAGSSAHLAATLVAKKARLIAAELLEAAPEDIDLRDGAAHVKGVPQLSRSLGELAQAVNGSIGFALPSGITPGLYAAVDFQVPGTPFACGAHVAEVEIDRDTGGVTLNRFVAIHDCGRVINPQIVEGQVLGAIVHGIGNALFEWMRYDNGGQPLTVTYGDCLLPTADVISRIEVLHMETPSPLNPIGVKGAAEGGAIAAPAAIASAIENALRPLGVRIRDLPQTPARLRALIDAAQAGA